VIDVVDEHPPSAPRNGQDHRRRGADFVMKEPAMNGKPAQSATKVRSQSPKRKLGYPPRWVFPRIPVKLAQVH
jgi:hypothetical protein